MTRIAYLYIFEVGQVFNIRIRCIISATMQWHCCLFAIPLFASCTSSGEPNCIGDDGTPKGVATITGAGDELSGLAASRSIPGLLWTIDDGSSDVFSIDGATGTQRGTLHLAGADPVDWEDLAVAPCSSGTCVYVADTGDNDLVRSTVSLLEATEPTSSPVGTFDVEFRRYTIRFSDAPRDLESLFIDPRDGKSYAISKTGAAAAEVFELPRVSGEAVAVRIGMFEPPSGDARVTSADLVVDDCAVRLAIRTRNRLFELRGQPETSIAELLAGDPHKLPVADEPQGESVAYTSDGRAYFTISEGTGPTLWRVDLQ